MNRLKKHVGTFAAVYGCAAGIAAFLFCFGLSIMLIAFGANDQLVGSHQRLTALIENITTEEEQLLASLNQAAEPDCAEGNLVQLRTQIFASRFIRDLGIYDEQNRLVCTTTDGVLRNPFVDPVPALREIRNGKDQSIWFNVPILLGKGKYHAMVMRQGRFNVVVNQSNLTSLLSGVDVVGLQLADNLPTRVFESTRLTPEWLSYLDEQTALKAPLKGFDWYKLAFVRTDYIAGTPWVLQSYRTLLEVLAAQASLVGFLAAASLVIAILVSSLLTPALERQRTIGARIHDLIREGQVQCFYQPIVDLGSGRWLGCEVLMRLKDGGQYIPPAEVLPEILRQHLGWQLDAHVMRTGMQELGRHMPATAGFKVAFNLFPENLDFARINALMAPILQGLQRKDLAIGVEIVEQSYGEGAIQEIAQLREAGYQVAVDDFGTGYSNLARVKRLAPDVLKIDRSFVYEMEDLSLRSSLIPEIIGIARAIGSQLVAEGIENQLQAAQLSALGIEFGQGYYFAKPMPIDAFVAGYNAQLAEPAHAPDIETATMA
ncbi:EAL domain-containing protein [Vogesella sp. LIG4]|uniref:EAL domain-containing protein n=1 Tax=Vogesella sp. LIG4 TaxID=1192162 RepID=UPI00081F8501|nr:EAL domain-containing protein [Vogesella sp. LIG4]SCK24843.1 sensor c-di-GMP phosphodiesterase, contains CSS-motif sensor and EAL domain [Vogesella sp. LIG4]